MLQLSCYNGARYLPFLFSSLRNQSLQDWRLIVLNNASTDEERALIQKAVDESGFSIELFHVEKNIGFAGAHNFLFQKHREESSYVALLNDDAILEPNYLNALVTFFESHPECASTSGLVYRWNFDERDESTQGKTNIYDTCGLRVSITGSVSDIRAGKSTNQFPAPTKPQNVFGVSGCLPCYRVSAVKQVSLDETLFEPLFVIYKEDVELAFRLRAAGYTAATIPAAIAYHRRSLGHGIKRTASVQGQYQSYRNHVWLHLIHTNVRDLFTKRCLVIPYEALKKIYWLIRKPKIVFDMIRETRTSWKALMRKRRFVQVIKNATQQRNGQPPVPPKYLDAKIAIIIVSHNDLNKECLQSLQDARNATSVKTTVVVADNASKKYDAHALVKETIPDAIILLRNGDFGFGRSCNRATQEVNASYCFFLNPDTLLTDPLILETLHTFAETHPDTGIIAPKVYYFDGRLQETIRRFPRWFAPFTQRTKLSQTDFGKKYAAEFMMLDDDHTHIRDIDWAQGSALFVRASAANVSGYFDDRYWMYFEDVDMCRSMHDYGKRVMYLPTVSLKHAHGKESAKYQSLVVNLIKNKTARAHILSWLKYLWKWK